MIYAYGRNDGSAVGGGNDGSDGSLTLGDVTEVFKNESSDLLAPGFASNYVAVNKSLRVEGCRAQFAKIISCQHEDILEYVYLNEAGHQRVCRNCYVERVDANDPQAHVPGEASVCTLCGVTHGDDVPYIDEAGEQQVCKEFKVFDAATVSREALGELGTETWYVVNRLENVVSGRFAAMGNVHLIICDGRDLTAANGIEVSENSSLTIYGQGGKAYLEAYGLSGDAGIGGRADYNGGKISINDIIVDVKGGEGAAGIGAGKGAQYESITLNRCVVTANGGEGGAGIGGGSFENDFSGNTGTISISYGSIKANGGLGAAGIGGGRHQNGGTIVIDGVAGGTYKDLNDDSSVDKITANGGKNADNNGGAAAIGGGEFGNGGTITINGGIILAIGGENTTSILSTTGGGGAGIGGGAGGEGGTITVDGGLIGAIGGSTNNTGFRDGGGAGIGGGDCGAAGTITITGGEIYAQGGTSAKDSSGGGAAIGGGDGGDGGTITITGGKTEAWNMGKDTQAFGRGDGGNEGTLTLGDNMCVYRGYLSDKNIKDSLCEVGERVNECRKVKTDYLDRSAVSVIPCEHIGAGYVIAEPANSGHYYTTCKYCNIVHGETQAHALNENAECVCGYHGVILNFLPGDAGDYAGTMDAVVLTGGTDYTLPAPDYTAPKYYEFTGWQIDGEVYQQGTPYTTAETRDETVTIDVTAQWQKTGHDWSEPTYTWSDNLASVTAKRVSVPDGDEEETETAATTTSVTKEADCTEAGEITYTAVFTNSAFAQQTKAVTTDALGHDWSDWTEINDSTGHYRKRSCSRCGSEEQEPISDDQGSTEPSDTVEPSEEKDQSEGSTAPSEETPTPTPTEEVTPTPTPTPTQEVTPTPTPAPASDEPEEITKVDIEDLTEVPESLKEIYSSADEIKEVLVEVVTTKLDSSVDGTETYDCELLYSLDNGATWIVADVDHFPEGGITVSLPYPEGTDSSYDFAVAHMFTEEFNGHKPGEIEYPTVVKGANGISFKVDGLSPITVGWKKAETVVSPAAGEGSANTNVTPSRSAAASDASGKTGANTGDTNDPGMWAMASLIAMICLASVVLYSKKRNNGN